MSVQNDNTLVTKGDLKELYTDKIAPYLGGGISYYHTDRTGEELKSAQYALVASTVHGSGTNATINNNTIVPFIKQNGDFESGSVTGTFKVPNGMRIEVSVYATVTNGASTNSHWYLYNVTDSVEIDTANGTNLPGAYLYGGQASNYGMSQSAVYQWTNNTGKTVDVGIRNTQSACEVRIDSTGMTVKEIGRIVDPVKYVSNNSDLQETPVGNIISYMGNSVPKHYLACDGTVYNIGSYPELEAFIIDEFGSINYFGGDGASTWAVPDLRGEFLRGTGTNSHEKQGSGAAVGVHQDGTEHSNGYQYGNTQGFYLYGNTGTYNSRTIKEDSVTKDETHYSSVSCSKSPQTGGAAAFTSRPTNTSVKYCIKYESTFHAFFSNAAYKVSIAASVASSNAVQLTFDSSDIIGDSSLISGNSLVAPMDGWYSLGMNWSQSGSGDIGYYIRVNGASGKGYNRGIFISDTLYLNKGDVITIWKESGSANSGRVNFCLLTSNYNPTIVSADSVYSENEQMIGYWTNGKPLYQKTLVFDNLTITTTQQNLGDLSSLNIDYGTIVDVNGYENGDRYFLNSSFVRCWLRVPLNNIGFISTDGSRTFAPLYITIQYTKTTDTASTLQVENSLLLNRPDLWVAGTEYHFGGGLYGQRFTGTPNIASGNKLDITLFATTNAKQVSSGGFYGGPTSWCDYGSPIISGASPFSIVANASIIKGSNDAMFLRIINYSWSSNITQYDIWITYRKA